MSSELALLPFYPPVLVDPQPAPEQAFNGSIASLIACYKTDPDSNYHKLRFRTRENYDSLLRRIERDHGIVDVRDVRGRTLLVWHKQWVGTVGHVAMAHGLIGMLRTLCTYGSTLLESVECRALKELLHDSKFEMARPRSERLTVEQVIAVRAKAHEMGFPSIALAQAFQFECTFRQKDVIGELVPLTERGPDNFIVGDLKWGRGLAWSEIDANMVLRHVTSKRQKLIEVDLKDAPMVREELALFLSSDYGRYLAASAESSVRPVIICELTGEPYRTHQFRRMWRQVAKAAGIPKHVRNMDTRSGAITEAIESGASLEDARKTATHSNTSQTANYSRGDAEAISRTLKGRAASRVARAQQGEDAA